MFSSFRLITGGIVIAILLGAGLYIKHKFAEAARVPNLVQTINLLEKQKTEARESAAKTLKDNDEIRKKLAATDDYAKSLVSRLRHAYQLPTSSNASSGDLGTGGTGTGPGSAPIDLAVERVVSACKADSIKLQGWQSWWDQVPQELKP